MRFMLLQNYGEVESDCAPMPEWTPADIKAHIEFQQALNASSPSAASWSTRRGWPGPSWPSSCVATGPAPR